MLLSEMDHAEWQRIQLRGKSRQHRVGWACEGMSVVFLYNIVRDRETLIYGFGINIIREL